MDPSIMKLLEDDEDETMHSGVDVEAFQAALNRDIGGDVSASQFSGSDAVLSQGSNNTSSQSISQWPTSNHDNQTDCQNQEPKTAQQEQHSSEMELKQHGSLGEHLQHVASQDVNNSHSSQKQSQDECHQAPAVQVPLHNSQPIGIQNSGKVPVLNNEVVKSHNPSSESQYAKLQQMSNQQATVSEQPSSQGNRSKQVPFGLLLPILLPQLAKDRAMQLQTLFAKLKKDEIPKDSFVRLMKGIVGDQMLRLALAEVQMQPQARPNQASAGQQLPLRMSTVSSGARQLNDPHALAQMHQRSMNVAVDQSRMSSSAGQTTESNARKPQEFDVKIESQGLQSNQLTSSSSNTVGQEAERTSVHIQGLNKQRQHHLHFASAYGNSGGNYNPFSGTTSSSTSSIKQQTHESHNQIPHQNIGSNHLGGSAHGLSLIGVPKLEQQNSFNDPKRLPGGSVSPAVNNTASQQTSNAWQPSTNKEQNLGLMSSVSYVKKEPTDLSTEQQNRHNLSKLHGYSSVNSAQLEQSGATQGTLKDEFSRGLPASTSMPPTTSTGLLAHGSASSSVITHLDSSVSIQSNASGIVARTPLKKSAVTQKKPLEALGSSPPPPSKKQKTSGGYVEQSIEQLNDVTAVSGVDLREEEEQLFSGPKEDSRVSEASRKAVQEEEERLILQKALLQKKLIDIMSKCGLKGMGNDVEKCLSLSVEERMRGLISNLIRISKQRVDFEKTRHRTVVTSDVRQQIMTINRKVREEWEKKQAEAEKLRRLNDVDSNTGVDGDKERDDGRAKSTKVNKEEDDKMRTNAANVAARAAYGGDDMLSKWQLMAEQAKQKREGGVDGSSGSQPAKDVNRKSSSTSERSTKENQEGEKRGSTPFIASSVARKLGKSHAMAPQTRVARSISVKDVIAVLEREPQMSKSPLIHRLYEKIHSDAPVEQAFCDISTRKIQKEKIVMELLTVVDDFFVTASLALLLSFIVFKLVEAINDTHATPKHHVGPESVPPVSHAERFMVQPAQSKSKVGFISPVHAVSDKIEKATVEPVPRGKLLTVQPAQCKSVDIECEGPAVEPVRPAHPAEIKDNICFISPVQGATCAVIEHIEEAMVEPVPSTDSRILSAVQAATCVGSEHKIEEAMVESDSNVILQSPVKSRTDIAVKEEIAEANDETTQELDGKREVEILEDPFCTEIEVSVVENGVKENDYNGDDDWEGINWSELEKEFMAATEFVTNEGGRLESVGSNVKMELYGLHKVATEGPCREPQPMPLKLSARAKWNAWQKMGNMNPEVAMEQYISLLSDKFPEWMKDTTTGMSEHEPTKAEVSESAASDLITTLSYQQRIFSDSELEQSSDSKKRSPLSESDLKNNETVFTWTKVRKWWRRSLMWKVGENEVEKAA
ncbi:unnamed protein product [Sphenostylis stenocarpa]|uniref:Uncharacterized protein n=1 Tax=Sphenostylis stenocarpa TaxID=92480 RepID=A0AA86SU18_9FABA|nr:unnamed protein product [Sphenostylis stenocarpa]